MKTAKIILASVAILALVGGAFAFKANRFDPSKQLWISLVGSRVTTTTTATAPGVIFTTTIPNCTTTARFATEDGTPVTTSTSSTRANVVTTFTAAGGLQFITTYPFCTQTVTATTLLD